MPPIPPRPSVVKFAKAPETNDPNAASKEPRTIKQKMVAITESLIERKRKDKEKIERDLEELSAHLAYLKAASDEVLELVNTKFKEEETASTHFDRIVAFLQQQPHELRAIADIENGTGIPKASVSAVLYRTHPHAFISRDLPGTTRAKAWGLKEWEDILRARARRSASAQPPRKPTCSGYDNEPDEPDVPEDPSPGLCEDDIPF
jgi:hypothetical protein